MLTAPACGNPGRAAGADQAGWASPAWLSMSPPDQCRVAITRRLQYRRWGRISSGADTARGAHRTTSRRRVCPPKGGHPVTMLLRLQPEAATGRRTPSLPHCIPSRGESRPCREGANRTARSRWVPIGVPFLPCADTDRPGFHCNGQFGRERPALSLSGTNVLTRPPIFARSLSLIEMWYNLPLSTLAPPNRDRASSDRRGRRPPRTEQRRRRAII